MPKVEVRLPSSQKDQGKVWVQIENGGEMLDVVEAHQLIEALRATTAQAGFNRVLDSEDVAAIEESVLACVRDAEGDGVTSDGIHERVARDLPGLYSESRVEDALTVLTSTRLNPQPPLRHEDVERTVFHIN